MYRQISDNWIVALAVLVGGINTGGHAQEHNPQLKLNTNASTVTFDPKTCEIGARGAVHTGCGGAAIQIIAQKDGLCIFDYRTDGCGGVLAHYRCKVPVDGGMVTVKVENGSIVNSFGSERMSLVSSGGPGGLKKQIDETGEYVVIKSSDRRSEMVPANGDTVKYRFHFYTGLDFKEYLPGAFYDPTEEFVQGSSNVWPWLRTAADGMAVGDRVYVEVPDKAAGGVQKWLKSARADEKLYVAVTLVKYERKK